MHLELPHATVYFPFKTTFPGHLHTYSSFISRLIFNTYSSKRRLWIKSRHLHGRPAKRQGETEWSQWCATSLPDVPPQGYWPGHRRPTLPNSHPRDAGRHVKVPWATDHYRIKMKPPAVGAAGAMRRNRDKQRNWSQIALTCLLHTAPGKGKRQAREQRVLLGDNVGL